MTTLSTKQRWFPNGLDQIITGDYGIECRYSNELKKAIFYAGKATKPLWYFRYSSVETMMERINQSLTNVTANFKHKEDEKLILKQLNDELKAFDYFKVDDIISNSWGYEQTNVEFYQVVRILNKKIHIKEISQLTQKDSTESHGMSCNVLPNPNVFLENGDEYTLTIKATFYKGVKGFRLSNPKSFYHFTKWDGSAKYKSWYH